MNAMEQDQSPFMSGLSKFSTLVAFISTIFLAPEGFTRSHGFITNFIYEYYGMEWIELAIIGWAILCALLIFHVINMVLQACIMLLAVIFAKILI